MHVSLCFLNNTWTNSEYNFTIIIASNIHDCYIYYVFSLNKIYNLLFFFGGKKTQSSKS